MAKSEAFNMDCMEALKEFPDKYFDLAVVDPPYGDGVAVRERERETASRGTDSGNASTATRRNDHLHSSCRKRERERENANAKSSRLRIAEGGQSAGLVEHGRRSSEKNH